jgi:hypothetical protein
VLVPHKNVIGITLGGRAKDLEAAGLWPLQDQGITVLISRSPLTQSQVQRLLTERLEPEGARADLTIEIQTPADRLGLAGGFQSDDKSFMLLYGAANEAVPYDKIESARGVASTLDISCAHAYIVAGVQQLAGKAIYIQSLKPNLFRIGLKFGGRPYIFFYGRDAKSFVEPRRPKIYEFRLPQMLDHATSSAVCPRQ